MQRKVAGALVAALALGLGTAGCGGSETTTVTRAELVHRLEVACLTAQRKFHMNPPIAAHTYLDRIIENQRYVLKQVGDLETTGPAKATFDGFKDTVRTRIVALQRVASASRADWNRVLARERPVISASGPRTHEALVALGARHVCY